MWAIKGTITNTDPDIHITKWNIMARDTEYLGQEQTVTVTTAGTTPTEYTLDLGGGGFPVYVVAVPFADETWKQNRPWLIGHIVRPYANPSLFLYELTDIQAVNNDPYWDNVMLRITGNAGVVDDKGHTITAGGTLPDWLNYVWSTPFSENYDRLGTGALQFLQANDYGPLIVDHLDMDLGTGDFTLQFWLDWGYSNTAGTIFCYGTPGSGTELKLEGARFGPARLWYGSTQIATLSNISVEYEAYILVREAGSLKIFKSGALEATVALAGTVSGPVHIGGLPGTPKLAMDATLWDFVVTKGVARFTEAPIPWQVGSLGPQPALTGTTEPTWPTTIGATVQDGGMIWTCKTRVPRPIMEGPLWPSEYPDV